MTTIAIKQFQGEIPATPAHLLPDYNAQYASNCDFSSGDLRPFKDGSLLKTMTNTVKGIYTEDGTNFFTWPYEAHAVKGPVIGDNYQRVYYTMESPLLMSVTQYSYATATGGTPSSAWTVGVPQPTVAPTLTLVTRTTVHGLSLTLSATAWWESNGKRYDSATATLATVTDLQQYTFTPPTATTAPADSRLVCNFVMTDATAGQVLNVTVVAGSDSPVRSNAFPGSVEFTLTNTGTLTLKWGIYEKRAYVYTTYNLFGEESAPSPASVIDVTYIQDVDVLCTTPDYTGYKGPSGYYVYRTFGTTSTYYRVGSATWGATATYSDTSYRASDVGQPLESLEWYVPEPALFGLTAMPNGSFAAYKDNVVYMSEPYRPHAWPYSMSFPKDITGLRMGAQALIVTTEEGCYYCVVSHPKNMQQQKLPAPQAGISHKGMTDVEGGVAFLSNDGIVAVDGSQAKISSLSLFNRDDWRSQFSSSLAYMWLGYHDGHLIGASTNASTGFIIRTDGKSTGSFSRYPKQISAMFRLPINDQLYYSSGTGVYTFKAGSYLTADWWSKDFVLGRYVGFGAFYIRCTGSVTVTLYADGVSFTSFTMTGTGYRRLPAGKGLRWSVRLQTAATVQEVVLAETMGELRSV